MKSIYIAGLTLALALQSCSHGDYEVPQKVLSNFNEKFSAAKNAVWESEDSEEWEAEFEWNSKNYSVSFSLDGQWLETEYTIKPPEIPENIYKVLNQHLPDAQIEEAEMSETVDGRSFELKIKTRSETMEVTINSKGNLIQEKEQEENNKNDKE